MSRYRSLVSAIVGAGVVLAMGGAVIAADLGRTAFAKNTSPLTATAGCGCMLLHTVES